jgi:methylenetetrahydrofolate reductase (NADPH)
VRLLPDELALDRLLDALVRNANVAELLLISGDYQSAQGPYSAVLDVLRTDTLQRHGLRRVSFAGHPEGHPSVPLPQIRRAEADKAELAEQAGLDATFVTQFFFEAAPFLTWAQTMKRGGVRSRIFAGIAGPAGLASLIKLAARCGVGRSVRALGARPGAVAKLLGEYSPDALLIELAGAFSTHDTLFDGLHIFSLGGFLRTCRWLHTLAEGRFD